jgi:hypothetical protein
VDAFAPTDPVEEDERIYHYAPEDLIGKAFLREDDANGDLVRAEIVQQLKTEHEDTGRNLKFLVETTNGDRTIEHIMDYADLCDLVEAQMEAVDQGSPTNVWTFKNIIAHQGPLTAKDPRYKGSSWNILIEWDVGEPTWEPLNVIAKSDPISVSLYGEENGLLNKKGWKYLKRHARNTRKVYRHVREILKARGNDGPRYKYGVRLPSRARECAELDRENGDTKWTDANQAELNLLNEFEAFEEYGVYTDEKASALIDQGYQFIKLMMIYDVKHDGRFRARLVAAGNMTRPGCDAYSSVVSFRTLLWLC